jgi:hypothetical protein
MNFLAHRGLWNAQVKGNSLQALQGALKAGFGVETDVRDFDGKLVLSHDPAKRYSLSLDDFLDAAEDINSSAVLALNVKADGLHQLLLESLSKHDLPNAFFFDMSFPTQYVFSKTFKPRNIATRQSEFEREPVLYASCGWIWIDCLTREWITKGEIKRHLKNGKKLCFVSPELHKRDQKPFWRFLREIDGPNLFLCTDLTVQAKGFFGD